MENQILAVGISAFLVHVPSAAGDIKVWFNTKAIVNNIIFFILIILPKKMNYCANAAILSKLSAMS